MQINNDFIRQHDRLVRVIVNQFKVANVDPEDLMQEGRIGLIEAAKRFDPSRGILVPSRELEDQLVARLRCTMHNAQCTVNNERNHETIYLDICDYRPDYEL